MEDLKIVVTALIAAWHVHALLHWRGRVRVSVELDSRE